MWTVRLLRQLMRHSEFEMMYAAISNHHLIVQKTTNLGTPKDQQWVVLPPATLTDDLVSVGGNVAVCPQTVHHRSLTLDRPGSVENEDVVFFMFYYAGLNVTMTEHVLYHRGIYYWEVYHCHVPLGGVSLGCVPLGHVPLGHVSLGCVPLGHVPLGHVSLGCVPLGHVPLGHVSLGCVPLGHVPLGHVSLGCVPLGHVPFGTCTAIGSILVYIMCVHDVLSQVVVSTDKTALDRFYLV